MQWIEAVVHTTTAGSDLVSDLLVRCGALGTQVMDRADVEAVKNNGQNDWELYDESITRKMPKDVLVKGWFSHDDHKNLDSLNELLKSLRTQAAGIDVGTLGAEVTDVADDDWAESWKRYYKPFRIGSRLIVKPTWEPYQTKNDDLVIEMDPGMAFGTGTHETTNMCMIMLEKYMKPGMRVMDIGTGSGILAIAAAKLGAKEVLAVDIDHDAVKVANENILRNNVQQTVRAVQGDMLRSEAIDCDLVVANIVAGAVCVLVEPMKRYLQKGGYFICSGIIREREQDVLDSFAESKYVIVECLTQGEWVAMCARGGT
jgi:ribosomal protein L11 methyltransferase